MSKINKIAFTADWHIYDKHRYSIDGSRLIEIERNITKMVLWCAKENIKILVVAGDIFHNYNPSEKLMKVLARIIMIAIEKGVWVRLMTGNHDTDGMTTSLDSISDFISIAPKVEEGFGQVAVMNRTEVYVEEFSNVAIHYIPWAEDLSELVEIAKNGQVKGKKNILFTHASVSGALTNTGFQLRNKKERRMDLKPIELIGWDFVGLGDFHMPQRLGNDSFKNNNKVYYCGSPFKLDWGERDHQKSFMYLDINDDIVEKTVKIPDIEFNQITIDYSEIDNVVEDNKGKIKDSFIKLFVIKNKNEKDVHKKSFKVRLQLLNEGAKDVYVHFIEKNIEGESVAVEESNKEIELDFYSICNKNLQEEEFSDSKVNKYLEYIKFLEKRIEN